MVVGKTFAEAAELAIKLRREAFCITKFDREVWERLDREWDDQLAEEAKKLLAEMDVQGNG
jgi:hypothetical protein